jgi:hypothetical protein
VQKYCDGNLKRTSKGGLKVSETVIVLREHLVDEHMDFHGLVLHAILRRIVVYNRCDVPPVLKHGPRSLRQVQVRDWCQLFTYGIRILFRIFCCSTAEEFLSMDPKDGELYLSRVKPGEILVEARFNTDVQIVCKT